MASNASKVLSSRVLPLRTFASAQAKPAVASNKPQGVLNTTILPNKTFVAALDTNAPIARVTIAYKAGSRYEPADESGLAHFVRAMAATTTTPTSGFLIWRNLQQYGARLSAISDRETICYTLEATKDLVDDAINFLSDIASKQIFNPWELQEAIAKIKYETAGLPKQVRACDLFHKAAFRRGLGNSIFCSPRRLSSISSESLRHYTAQNFVADRCSIGVSGLPLERAVAIAQSLGLPAGKAQTAPSPYKGGEMRKEMGGELAHIVVGTEGAALNNAKEAVALAILARAMASGPKVKWGNDNSPLAKAIAEQVGNVPFAIKGFNVSYSDTGIFGVIMSAPYDKAGKAASVAVQALKKASSVGSDAIARARNELFTEVVVLGDSYAIADEIAIQGLLAGSASSTADIATLINNTSDSDVNSVASKISNGKLSMSAVGNLSAVPYLDEL